MPPEPGGPLSRAFPQRLAAVIRWKDGEEARQAVLAAVRAGIASVEVTSGTPGAFDLVRELRQRLGDSRVVGAGTITTAELARAALASGAQYLVTPYLSEDVAAVARPHDVLLVMGATTPSEIARAQALGADLVKVFPAGPIGGASYIAAIRGPMPEVPLWVSGGIRVTEIADYLKAGAQVVGLTADLFRPQLLSAHRWEEIESLARTALEAVAAPGSGAADPPTR
ncbi:MAG: bifunctional 4-hydroxy-2-oxoglutarate aldolase/2-dehydro-3-deoxy-phosphogluconate aldolase [Candidatus Dormibacteria bacterium]